MRSMGRTRSSLRQTRPSFSVKSRLILPVLCIISFMLGLNYNNYVYLMDPPNHSELLNADLDHERSDGSDDRHSTQTSSLIKNLDATGNGGQINSNDYQLANVQSHGFFNDIPSNQWKMYQEIVAQYEPHRNPSDPLEYVPGHSKRTREWFNSPKAFYQTNYEPNFSCAFERRIGGNGNGDGPKWVCDPHRIKRMAMERKKATDGKEGCLVYSIGSNGDFQFETGLQKLLGTDACEVHIFDFGDYEAKTPQGLNLHYHQWGLTKGLKNGYNIDPKTTDDKFYSIHDTVKKLGHEGRIIDIFKIDCEKCEWRTHEDWFGPSIPMIQQILVETHNSPQQHVLPFFDGIMAQGYVMYHKEPNIQFAHGDAIEFGFLKLHDQFFADVESMKSTQ